MKNVLMLVHDDPGQEARLQAALDIVRGLDGHLTCLDVVGIPVELGYPSPEIGAVLVAEEERVESENRGRLLQRLKVEDVPWTLSEARGAIDSCLQSAAGLSDLIVLNPRLEHDGPDMRSIASNVLMRAGKPVVVVPEHHLGFAVDGAAMVAWDGSLPAMAALTAAIPLLKLAGSVRLLEIQGSSRGSVREAAAYLSRHDIRPEVDLVAVPKDAARDLGEVIEQMCVEAGCGYCVMGAYGHSPMREALFGGVTRRMLTQSRIPLLLAH